MPAREFIQLYSSIHQEDIHAQLQDSEEAESELVQDYSGDSLLEDIFFVLVVVQADVSECEVDDECLKLLLKHSLTSLSLYRSTYLRDESTGIHLSDPFLAACNH